MAKISIENSSFNIEKKEHFLSLNGKEISHDLLKNPNRKYHLIVDNLSYQIQVLQKETSSGKLILRINNRVITTNLDNKLTELLKKMGMESGKKKLKDLKAPMPGLVLDILTKEGEQVIEGQELIVLEAMKMENAIKSPQDGVIRSINVQQKDKIDKNHTLLSFE